MAFLNQIRDHYPKKPRIVRVLDNARIHPATLIQPLLAEHAGQLTLLVLPPCRPQSNPIEGRWGWLNRSATYPVSFGSVLEIIAAVDGFLKRISQTPIRLGRATGVELLGIAHDRATRRAWDATSTRRLFVPLLNRVDSPTPEKFRPRGQDLIDRIYSPR